MLEKTQNKIKVSVIIPFYNAEKYITKNILSLKNQKLKEIEIIYVDDGSNDKTACIINSYIKTDNRIKLIKQKNSGSGVARNNGLKYSTGEYVIFLDSDDFFEPNMLQVSYKKAINKNAEVVMFGYWYYDNEKNINKKATLNGMRGMHSASEYGKNIFRYTEPVPWNKLIKKSLIIDNDLSFQKTRNGNDETFSRLVCLLSNKTYCIKNRYVHYRTNNINSLQGKLKKENSNILCGFDVALEIKRQMNARGLYYGDYKIAYARLANTIIEQRVKLALSNSDDICIVFDYLKENAIVKIFEGIDSELIGTLSSTIDSVSSVDEFLRIYLQKQLIETVKKTSLEYRIGKRLTSIISAIYQYVQ